MKYKYKNREILGYDNYTIEVRKQLLDEAKKILDSGKSEDKENGVKLDKRKIFIVHGHDNEGMTIIKKIDKYSNIWFAIVLYTTCDIGYPKDNDSFKNFRERQNVVFEYWYLISKIGRNNVCELVKQDVEIPNDISGVVYIPMDKHSRWKLPLSKEIKSS